MIPYCSLNANKDSKDKREPECNLFDPVFTNQGLCHSFDALQTSKLLHPSYFKESFENAFKSDLTDLNIVLNLEQNIRHTLIQKNIHLAL